MKASEIAHYEALHQVAKAVNSTLSVQEVLKSIVRSTAKAMNATACSLMLLDSSKKKLVHKVDYGLSGRYIRKGLLDADKSLAQVLKGKVVTILNAAKDRRVQYPELAVENDRLDSELDIYERSVLLPNHGIVSIGRPPVIREKVYERLAYQIGGIVMSE